MRDFSLNRRPDLTADTRTTAGVSSALLEEPSGSEVAGINDVFESESREGFILIHLDLIHHTVL